MTAPIAPDDMAGLAEREAKVLVSYWTLDCVLDWVFHHSIHKDEDWSCETHYEQLREEMNSELIPPGHHVIADDDLRAVLDLAKSTNWTPELVALVERLREKVEEQ